MLHAFASNFLEVKWDTHFIGEIIEASRCNKPGDMVWLVWTGVKTRSKGKRHLAFSFEKVLCSWLLFGESSVVPSWDAVRSSAGSLCWETWFGMLTSTWRASQGLSLLDFFFFSRFERDRLVSLQHCVHTTQLRLPPCSIVIRFSYTCRGTVRRWICDPLRSRPQDPRDTTSEPGRMFSSSYTSWRDDSMPRAVNFCFRWVWWEILLFWQCYCFPASFHFLHWAKPWGFCNLSQPWTKRPWTTGCDFSVHFQLTLL